MLGALIVPYMPGLNDAPRVTLYSIEDPDCIIKVHGPLFNVHHNSQARAKFKDRTHELICV